MLKKSFSCNNHGPFQLKHTTPAFCASEAKETQEDTATGWFNLEALLLEKGKISQS